MKQFVSQNRGVLVLASIFLYPGGEGLWELIRAERYVLAVAFLIATTVFVTALVSAFRDPKRPLKGASYYLTKLWEMPLETTRTGLWMRSGFLVVMGLALYSGLMYDSWLDDDGKIDLALSAVDGMKVLLWLPFLYWVFRKQYIPVPSNQFDDNNHLLQKSACIRDSSPRDILKVVLVMVVAYGMLAVIGMWLR